MTKRTTLTRAAVEAAKPQAKHYRIHDAKLPALFIRVLPSGVKTWYVTWARNKERAIGKWPGVTVEAARVQAVALLVEVDTTGAPGKKSTSTVADACRDYVAALRKDGRDAAADDAERRFERTVYSDRIGKLTLSKLAQDDLESWRDRIESGELADLPSKKGRPPTAKPLSKASVNRMRTVLVAALNRAVSRRKVTPDRAIEWESLKPYDKVGNRREIYLDVQQRRAWLASAAGDLRDIMECIALTGCRPGDPPAVFRRDYDAKHGAVMFRTKGHARKVALSPAAKSLFDRLSSDKSPDARLFTNGGAAWRPHDWRDHVKEAASSAGLPSGVVLYTLRHCWITDAIVGGMDLLTVARLSGTSLAMIEKHYGHLVQGAARDKLAEINFL
jgi:hypothetical protein